jgi:hypothetical protein
MAGDSTITPMFARAVVDLLPAVGVPGVKVRMVGPDLCPTGH